MKKIFVLVFLIGYFITLTRSMTASEIERIKVENITDEEVKSQIHSMYILDDVLHVNDLVVEMVDGYYSFSIGDTDYQLIKQLDNYKLSFSYPLVTKEHLWIQLATKNGIHTLFVYPDITDEKHYELQGQIVEDYVYFDNYLDYTFLIDLEKNVLFVNDQEIALEKGNQTQKVFFEAYISKPYLNVSSLDYLEKKEFIKAKEEKYEDNLIEMIAPKELVTLYNSKSNYEIKVRLREYIYYWPRVGKEEYIVQYDSFLKEVYQYDDAIAEGIKVGERKYAIFSHELTYQGVEIVMVEKPVIVKKYADYSGWLTYSDYIKKVKNLENYETDSKILNKVIEATFPDEYKISKNEIIADEKTDVKVQYRSATKSYGSWSDYVYSAEQAKELVNSGEYVSTSKVLYAKSVYTWSDYSKYVITDNTQACILDTDCRFKRKILYAKQMGTWSDYSAYIYNSDDQMVVECASKNDCDVDSKTLYARVMAKVTGEYSDYVSECSISNAYRCMNYYKYTCNKGIFNKTKYSTVKYSLNTQGVCDANYTISKREDGYRKQYIKYDEVESDDYTLNSCTSVTGYIKCYSQEKVAIRTRIYADKTDYIYESCKGNSSDKSQDEVTLCYGKMHYAYSYRNWSALSDYIYESSNDDANTKWKSKTMYAVRKIYYSDWSSWGTDEIKDTSEIKVEKRWLYRNLIEDGYNFYEEEQEDSVKEKAYRYRTYIYVNSMQEVPAYQIKKKVLADYEEVSEKDIKTLSADIGKEVAISEYIKDNDLAYLEVSESYNIVSSDWLLKQKVFVPYVYIKPHWRAQPASLYVTTLKGNYEEYHEEISFVESDEEVDSEIVTKANGKVIYFDYQNPLSNYEVLPSNWNDALVEKIKSNDEIAYSIRLKKNDIKRIKLWLKNNNSKIGTGKLLQEIIYGYSD